MHVAVVFEERENFGILRFLKQGFRHCMILMGDEKATVFIDPLMGKTDIRFVAGNVFFDCLQELSSSNRKIIYNSDTKYKNSRRYNIRILNCVEVIKSLIGISDICVLTPFSLYRYLMRSGDWQELS